MKLFLSRCRNSMGSSMVIKWSARVALMRSMIAASVVDLPEPVVPVTRIRPRCSSQILLTTEGRFSSSLVRIFVGMTRSTMPTLPRCGRLRGDRGSGLLQTERVVEQAGDKASGQRTNPVDAVIGPMGGRQSRSKGARGVQGCTCERTSDEDAEGNGEANAKAGDG